jgi:hypothetical protein
LEIVKLHDKRVLSGRSAYNWDGLTFEKKGDEYIITVNGKPLEENREYELATIDFLTTTDLKDILGNKEQNYTKTTLRNLIGEQIRKGLVNENHL